MAAYQSLLAKYDSLNSKFEKLDAKIEAMFDGFSTKCFEYERKIRQLESALDTSIDNPVSCPDLPLNDLIFEIVLYLACVQDWNLHNNCNTRCDNILINVRLRFGWLYALGQTGAPEWCIWRRLGKAEELDRVGLPNSRRNRRAFGLVFYNIVWKLF